MRRIDLALPAASSSSSSSPASRRPRLPALPSHPVLPCTAEVPFDDEDKFVAVLRKAGLTDG